MKKTSWIVALTLALIYGLFAIGYCIRFDAALGRYSVRQTIPSLLVANSAFFIIVVVFMLRPKREE